MRDVQEQENAADVTTTDMGARQTNLGKVGQVGKKEITQLIVHCCLSEGSFLSENNIQRVIDSVK